MERADSEWDEHQQGLMLALAEYEAGLCSRCGHPMDEAWAPKAEYRYEEPIRCHACDAHARARDAYRDNPYPEALIHLVQRRPPRG